MKQLITIIIACILWVTQGQAQTGQPEVHYENAFGELKAMLSGEKPLSFKRAVFVTENAYLDNTLDYQQYLDQIQLLAHLGNRLADQGALDYKEKDREDVAKKFAAYRLMKDTVPFIISVQDTAIGLTTKPYTYDFTDFFGEKDWTQMLVTKLLYTHQGNCHSLPFLYKIIAEEMGTDAYLAMSPNHTYIKQWADQTGWFNTELTSGQFPIDSWIMASGYIKLEAIQNGLYMDTLGSKQSIAVALTDLAQGYRKKFGTAYNDGFVLKCLDLALAHYPNYANALLLKAEVHKARYGQLMEQRQVEKPADLWNDPEAKKQFEELQAQYVHIHRLGYRRMPKEMYLNWLMDIEEKDTDKKLERYTFEPPQPFKEYGQQVKVTTLSRGKYQEFFDMDTVVRVGSVFLNRLTGKLTHFIAQDTVYSEATLEPEVISRWLSPDPLAEEFYNWSPYNFVYNNPISHTDPDGRSPVNANCPGCPTDDDIANALATELLMAKHSVYNLFSRIFGYEATFVDSENGGFRTGFVETNDGYWETVGKTALDMLSISTFRSGSSPTGGLFAKKGWATGSPIRQLVRNWTGIMSTRFKIADNFYRKSGFSDYDDHLAGINFEMPVSVLTLKKGTVIEQWVREGGEVGSYFAKPGADPRKLGISTKGRVKKTFELTEDTKVLKSTAKDISGHTGGETQFFNPQIKYFLKEIDN